LLRQEDNIVNEFGYQALELLLLYLWIYFFFKEPLNISYCLQNIFKNKKEEDWRNSGFGPIIGRNLNFVVWIWFSKIMIDLKKMFYDVLFLVTYNMFFWMLYSINDLGVNILSCIYILLWGPGFEPGSRRPTLQFRHLSVELRLLDKVILAFGEDQHVI